jgi:polysaccharide biosynthesis/export protein ExoF
VILMKHASLVTRIILLCFTVCVGTISHSYADYRLGPRDKIRIKVSEWRQATGQIYEWNALSGEYVVSQDGTIALPIVGALTAGSMTTAELADLISDRAREKIGLATRPTTAVEIVKYGPIYILGDVDKPGEYEFQPRMTAIEAISLAGGLFRSSELRRLGRETITSEGDLRVLATTRITLLAQQTRLRAEIGDSEDISFPPELMTSSHDGVAAGVMSRERLFFQSRRKALQSKLESFSRTITLLRQEVEVLESKRVSVERQFTLATQELANVNKLIEQKLAVASRQLAVEQTVAQLDSARLDIGLAIVRGRQDIAKAERDAADAVNTHKNEALKELANIDGQLLSTAERRNTLHRLIDDTRFAWGLQQQRMTLIVLRKENGTVNQIVVGEGDALRPGDVLKVTVDLPSADAGTSGINAIR